MAADAARWVPAQPIGREATPQTFAAIESEIRRLYRLISGVSGNLATATAGGGGGGSSSGAPSDAAYLVGTADAALTAARVVTDTATVAWDLATAGQAKAAVPDAAITDAKLRDSAALSVLGRASNSSGAPADLVAGSDGTVLVRRGTMLVFDTVAAGDISDFDHDLLSPTHPDTVPASPEVGAIVVGVAAAPVDLGLYTLDGLPYSALLTTLDASGGAYWRDGLAYTDLGGLIGTTVWQKLAPTRPNTIPVFDGAQTAWQSLTPAGVGASLYCGVSTSVSLATATPISFTAAHYDTATFWTPSAPTLLTVPAGGAGKYLLIGQLGWDLATVGTIAARLLVNGSVVAAPAAAGPNGSFATPQQAVTVVDLAVADRVQLAAYIESTIPGARTVTGGSRVTFLQLMRVG